MEWVLHLTTCHPQLTTPAEMWAPQLSPGMWGHGGSESDLPKTTGVRLKGVGQGVQEPC